MKTAISLPDALFRSADALAGRLGISRSQLYATALAEYLAKHQARKVTEKLNEVYSVDSGRLGPGVKATQARTLRRSKW